MVVLILSPLSDWYLHNVATVSVCVGVGGGGVGRSGGGVGRTRALTIPSLELSAPSADGTYMLEGGIDVLLFQQLLDPGLCLLEVLGRWDRSGGLGPDGSHHILLHGCLVLLQGHRDLLPHHALHSLHHLLL